MVDPAWHNPCRGQWDQPDIFKRGRWVGRSTLNKERPEAVQSFFLPQGSGTPISSPSLCSQVQAVDCCLSLLFPSRGSSSVTGPSCPYPPETTHSLRVCWQEGTDISRTPLKRGKGKKRLFPDQAFTLAPGFSRLQTLSHLPPAPSQPWQLLLKLLKQAWPVWYEVENLIPGK